MIFPNWKRYVTKITSNDVNNKLNFFKREYVKYGNNKNYSKYDIYNYLSKNIPSKIY